MKYLAFYPISYIVPTVLVLILRSVGLAQGTAFGFILDFTGGIAASVTSFVMPALIYLKLIPQANAKWYWHAVAMLLFGIFILFTVPIVNILLIAGSIHYE
jgi:hypothetical protein